MSSSMRKHPLTELRQPAHNSRNASRSMPNTPTRWHPSTPHALRALQERSAGKTRSARTLRTIRNIKGDDVVRPDSARGILRRLAKITAANTKSARTPTVVLDKENIGPEDREDENDVVLKKPRLTLELDEDDNLGTEGDASGLPESYIDDEDSELIAAPTPSVLPDDDDTLRRAGEDRSITFKSIDFTRQPQAESEKVDRRKSRVSFGQLRSDADELDDDDEDPTIMTERGRRAVSEEMTGRLSRYSFGSIRMSDFGEELEVRRESDTIFQQKLQELRQGLPGRQQELLEGETELLDRLKSSIRQSPSMVDQEGPIFDDDGNEDFQLFVPENDAIESAPRGTDDERRPELASSDDGYVDEPEPVATSEPQAPLSPGVSRRLTSLETAALGTKTWSRSKKRLKQTRHGVTIPSLPSSVIKRIATETQVRNGRRRPKLGKDHMKALEQATEWFFEQVGEDLGAYAEHARRKKRVTADDVVMLMRRTRVLKEEGELRRLAEEVLPEEVAAELDLPNDL